MIEVKNQKVYHMTNHTQKKISPFYNPYLAIGMPKDQNLL